MSIIFTSNIYYAKFFSTLESFLNNFKVKCKTTLTVKLIQQYKISHLELLKSFYFDFS